MRAVLDEGVPRDLAKALTGAGITTDLFDDSWAGLKNGELIGRVEAAGYAVLITNDRNMTYQQNLEGRSIAVLALPSNRQRTIIARTEDIADTIRRAAPGVHLVMNMDGTRFMRGSPHSDAIVEMLPPVQSFSDRDSGG